MDLTREEALAIVRAANRDSDEADVSTHSGKLRFAGYEFTIEEVLEDRCDPENGYHSTPHRGCILR